MVIVICVIIRYMGHGAGEKYLGKKELDLLQNLDNLIVLMGCCSARMLSLDSYFYKRKALDGILNDYISSGVFFNKKYCNWKFMVSYR